MTHTKYRPASLRSPESCKPSRCPGGNMGAAREKGQSWKCLDPSPAGLTLPTPHPLISKEAGNTECICPCKEATLYTAQTCPSSFMSNCLPDRETFEREEDN